MSTTGRVATGITTNLADEVVQQAAPFPKALVEEMVKGLVKAMRAHQLYLENNPMHQRALDLCRAAFVPVWKETTDVTLAVTETELQWYGNVVLVEAEKASDSLPWLLYKDGIREIQILAGFDKDELVQLLGLIQRVRRASPDEDDLITLLWEQDFACLQYKYVELSQEGFTAIEKGAFEERKVEVVNEANSAAASASGIISMSDFDSTLYFLEPTEISYLQNEVVKEYASDLRSSVAAMLLDIFETQADDHVRDELLELLDYYLIHLLSTHSFAAASYLIRECAAAALRARAIAGPHKDKLEALPARLSEREALVQLLQALDDSPSLPARGDLEELFAQLRGSSLEIILGWITRSQNTALKPLLEAAAQRLASSNTSELVRLIDGKDRDVRLEAMRRAGALKTSAAVAPLSRSVSDADAEVRLVAVMALSGIASPGALQALERSIEDEARDVRIATVRFLGSQAYKPALPRVESAIKKGLLKDADLTEKMAFFEAYGALAGEPAIQLLDGILNGKGLFGKREDAEVRACAAMALGMIGSDSALSSLQKASGEKDPIVRSAINKAFRGPTT